MLKITCSRCNYPFLTTVASASKCPECLDFEEVEVVVQRKKKEYQQRNREFRERYLNAR